MRRIAATLVVLTMAAASAPAARADDASRLRIARDVVEVAHAGDHMKALMPTFLGQMKGMLKAQGTVDDKQAQVFLDRFQARFAEGIPAFVDLVAEVYAREFSEEDLTNLLAFYRTPAGQHLLDKQVPIAQAMAQVGARWGQSIAGEVVAQIKKEHDGGVTSPKL